MLLENTPRRGRLCMQEGCLDEDGKLPLLEWELPLCRLGEPIQEEHFVLAQKSTFHQAAWATSATESSHQPCGASK